MLCKLAFGNLRRNFHNYWAYFLSAAFSAFVLYLFLSVTFGRVAASVAAYQSCQAVFSIGAGLTGLFTVFFLWYSNTFFIKSRKKEFATYLLLGMSKKQTVRLCLVENFAILALAYATGIAAGLLLNKLLIMALFHIIAVQQQVPFEINWQALKTTSLVYGGVFVLIALHSALLLSRNNLIDLINAARKAKRPLRVSVGTYLLGLLALGLLGLGYFLAVTQGTNPLVWLVCVILVCLGTALFFTSVGALFFHFRRRDEAGLYRGTGLLTVSQLMHRYRGNVGVLSIIAITTSVALCAVMSCCSLFNKAEDSSRQMRPFSVEYTNTGNGADAAFHEALARHPEVALKASVRIDLLRVDDTADGENGEHYLISESNYNEILAALGRPDDAVALAGDGDCALVMYEDGIAAPADLTVYNGGREISFAVRETRVGAILSLDRFRGTLVVRDGVFAAAAAQPGADPYSVSGDIVTHDLVAGAFSDDVKRSLPEENRVLTFYDHYMDSLRLMGVMVFVGVFVGLLFVAATGGILYFRMAMEAGEDRDKYVTLAKLGVSTGELRGSIARQLAVVFGAPFALAVANSFAAMFQLERMVTTLHASMKGTFLVVVAVYLLAYGAYYLLTLNKYVHTVRFRN